MPQRPFTKTHFFSFDTLLHCGEEEEEERAGNWWTCEKKAQQKLSTSEAPRPQGQTSCLVTLSWRSKCELMQTLNPDNCSEQSRIRRNIDKGKVVLLLHINVVNRIQFIVTVHPTTQQSSTRSWLNKLIWEESKVPRTLFEAGNVAESATYKQGKTVRNCVVFKVGFTHETIIIRARRFSDMDIQPWIFKIIYLAKCFIYWFLCAVK